jgi:hypothetical protein
MQQTFRWLLAGIIERRQLADSVEKLCGDGLRQSFGVVKPSTH